jgi:glycosyltransferase involved in cell wall biosynthesis
MWSNFGPYILDRLEASQTFGQKTGRSVSGLELAGRINTHAWQVHDRKTNKVTLFPEKAVEEVSALESTWKTWRTLERLQPDILAICGYDRAAMLTALAWAKLHGKMVIFMSDSKADDRIRQGWKERLKRLLVRRFDAALVGGRPHKEYAVFLGVPPERVFVGYDVVNNEHYAKGTHAARSREALLREELGLPLPYFLAVCRFIQEKNLVRFFSAYRLYRHLHPQAPWDLVLCGSGPLEAKLEETVADLPGVHFPGFIQGDYLPAYYALAQALILPSISETWGLVVNEAMSSGLPVLVSKACGCASDLVREGVNGFTFDPYDVEGLATLMAKMSSGDIDLKAMGEASRRIIGDWTPEVFAQNLFRAIDVCFVKKKGFF